MDGEFEHLREELVSMGVTLHETSQDEHVGDIEWFIHTIKERMRAIYNTLPFQKVPARLIIEMAKASVFWLNSLPQKNGLHGELSPRTIVTGQKLDFKRHCRFQFGEYVQTHEEHDNSMSPRTVGALPLRPTGNAQGSFYFMSLSTGRVWNRLCGTALPMPDDVVDRVHQMAQRQEAHPGLLFGDHNMNPTYEEDDEELSDDEEDEEYIPEEHDDESQIDVDEDGSIGDDHDGGGPTEVNYNESMDDNGRDTQNENDLDGLSVGPEMDNTEDLAAENSANSGVSDIENIGVDPVANDMIYQVEESVDNPELDEESESSASDGKENVIADKLSTENDEKEDVTADEANVESTKES